MRLSALAEKLGVETEIAELILGSEERTGLTSPDHS
jgi:hypothetical protein